MQAGWLQSLVAWGAENQDAARLRASAVTLMWGLGLVSTLQTQFPLLDDGTAPAPPISGFAYKGQEAD